MPSNDFSTVFDAAGSVVAAPVLNQTGGNPVLSGLASVLDTVNDDLDASRTRRRQAETNAREQARFNNEQADRARAEQERQARSAAYRAIYGVNRRLGEPAQPTTAATGTPVPMNNTSATLAGIADTGAFHQEAGALATGIIDSSVANGVTDADTARRVRDAAAAAAPVIQSQETAVAQGRLPSLAVAATVDRVFGELINQFPGQEHIVAAAFKEMGVDSALFDELRSEVDRVSSDRAQEQETRDTAYNRGMTILGPEAAEMSHDEIVAAGFEALRNEQELQALTAQAELQAKRAQINLAQVDLTAKERDLAGDEIVNRASEIGVAQLAPLLERYNRIVSMMGQPGADPGLEARLANLQTLITQQKGVIIGNLMAAIAPNASVEDAGRLREHLDNYFDQTFIQPLTMRNEENTRALNALTSRVGLQIQTAIPFVSALRSVGISPAAMAPLIEALPDEMLQRVQREISGLATLDFRTPTARQQLVEIVEILKGNRSLQSMNYDSRTASQAFRTVRGVSRNLATTINRTGDVSTANEFLSATGEVIVAARQLNSATPAQSLINAGMSLLGPNFGGRDYIGAINRLRNTPEHADRANIIARGYRAAAGKALLNLRDSSYGESGRFQIVWRSGVVGGRNYGDGRFEIVDTERRRTPSAADLASENTISAEMPGGTTGITTRHANARPHQDLQDMVRTMNGLLDMLIETNDWGDGTRGTPREIRRFYARGEVPAGMLAERQRQQSASTTIRSEIDSLERALLNPDASTLQTNNTASPSRPRTRGAVALEGNNPGGIVDSNFARSQPGYTGSNGRFASFRTMEDGRNAAVNLLSSYLRRGYNTPLEITRRYAPSSDGNDPVAYANRIARALGINPNDTIPPSRVRELAAAMWDVENPAHRTRG